MTLVVVMPSRGRPTRAAEAVAALRASAVLPDTEIVVVVDDDDPTAGAYGDLVRRDHPRVKLWSLTPDVTGDLVRATNTAAMALAARDPESIIGNLGDDHIVRTWGWDRMIVEALAEPGIAYGDDRFQGEALPTAPFISASIVNALGWYFLPTCRHLFVDNATKDIGEALGRLRYLPDIVIEHMHPLADKAKWDDGYRRANGSEMVERDKAAYWSWRQRLFDADVARVEQALRVAA